MALIAKRKLHQTWRDAVAARASGTDAEIDCLASFDAALDAGKTEAEAAFRALGAHSLLWDVQGPTDPGPATAPARAAEALDPHRVPNV